MFRVFRILLAAAPLLWAHAALAGTIAVSTPDELRAAYREARGGDEIRLAPGAYGTVSLRNGGGSADAPVTLASGDPSDPARIGGLTVKGAAHLVLSDLVFDYGFTPGDEIWMRPFQLLDVRDVTIRDTLFDGDMARGTGPASDGFPTAFGLGVRGSDGVTLIDNEIRGFFRGLVVSDSRDVVFRDNDVHSLRMDGLNFAQVERVTIEGNKIHDFLRSPESKDHADMIQFWTNGTDRPSRDITIRDNVLDSGDGLYTQSIFMRNDQVDRGLAGDEMFYRDVTIENNLISNAHLHGITIGETDGLRIANNTVIRNARSKGKKKNRALWIPQIRVSGASRNVEITRNVTSKIVGADGRADWKVGGNVMVQDEARMRPGHYSTVFAGDPSDLSAMRYLPDGPLGRAGIGAPQLDR